MSDGEAWIRAIIEIAQQEALADGLVDDKGEIRIGGTKNDQAIKNQRQDIQHVAE